MAAAGPDPAHRLGDDLVGTRDGVAIPGDADVVGGRIGHRTDDVDQRREILDALADVRVVVVERRVAEDVDRQTCAVAQHLPRRREKPADGPSPGLLRADRRVPDGAERPLAREAKIVELDLIEPLGGGLDGELQRVRPGLVLERIDPGEPFPVHPGPARPSVEQRPRGAVAGEDVVLEHDDARDRVDAPGLEPGQRSVEAVPTHRAPRARLHGQLDGGRVGNEPTVALHVDHDRVELGAVEEIEDATADGRVGDAVVAQIDGLDDGRRGPSTIGRPSEQAGGRAGRGNRRDPHREERQQGRDQDPRRPHRVRP